ncbi:hypothetical protein KZX46_01400 (plasmid) [Polymorphobacter sp. PAMC 29334]|uniref:hypothetical protein n=1 Tax=Polymorphobacter sp. PAMC 29334 TaxID=2862331 RepID=UPI001C77A6FC|nr:hypothetical protein [Polymorphobacter sp. PAMC 29334]QYE33463.1 hypothetical protein KZX46_01400 [Polymorphobacter sp. PAMC 29334]
MFAQRGLVPEQFYCRRSGALLIVDIDVEAVDRTLFDILLQKVRALVLIDRARIVGSRA